MEFMKISTKLYLILALVVLLVAIALPREDKILSMLGIKDTAPKIRLGLDLQGGASLTFQADLSGIPQQDKAKAIEGVINVMNKRVNATGTSEAVVQTSGADRIAVQLPGEKDLAKAISLIGKTAELKFLSLGPDGVPLATDLTGKDLAKASADFDPQTGQPIVKFEMKGDAINKFADLTTKINNSCRSCTSN